jgi:hypothetical protein
VRAARSAPPEILDRADNLGRHLATAFPDCLEEKASAQSPAIKCLAPTKVSFGVWRALGADPQALLSNNNWGMAVVLNDDNLPFRGELLRECARWAIEHGSFVIEVQPASEIVSAAQQTLAAELVTPQQHATSRSEVKGKGKGALSMASSVELSTDTNCISACVTCNASSRATVQHVLTHALGQLTPLVGLSVRFGSEPAVPLIPGRAVFLVSAQGVRALGRTERL